MKSREAQMRTQLLAAALACSGSQARQRRFRLLDLSQDRERLRQSRRGENPMRPVRPSRCNRAGKDRNSLTLGRRR